MEQNAVFDVRFFHTVPFESFSRFSTRKLSRLRFVHELVRCSETLPDHTSFQNRKIQKLFVELEILSILVSLLVVNIVVAQMLLMFFSVLVALPNLTTLENYEKIIRICSRVVSLPAEHYLIQSDECQSYQRY